MRISKRNLERIARGELPEPSEADIQEQITNGLFVLGYAVYITSRRPKRCQCGRWPKSGAGDGASRGLADLIVRKRTWPRGVCLSLEVKCGGPVRYSSEEQKAAALAGDIVVVQSLEEAVLAADAFDAGVQR